MVPGRTSGVCRSISRGLERGMRSTVAAAFLLASMIGAGTAVAAECPPGALGVSRTIVVDPSEHVRLGAFQYSESLPLRDREIVLTFDDGPLPPYTNRILDMLASECVKATFFMVGRMVRAYPSVVRRIYNDGHTIANHSQNHPFTFHKMTVDQASHEIEGGFESLRAVLGDPKAVAPFFRIPGLLRQNSVEQYLAAHNYMTWSVDFVGRRLDPHSRPGGRAARRQPDGGARQGHPAAARHPARHRARLPEILRELKARGFKIVHVVPATADRPKTVTEPELWSVRRTPEQKIWPRTLVRGGEQPRAGPHCAEPDRVSASSDFGPDDQSGDGADFRAASRARRRGSAAAGSHVAAPGGLFGARASSGAAGAGRAQFQLFPPVPVRRTSRGSRPEARDQTKDPARQPTPPGEPSIPFHPPRRSRPPAASRRSPIDAWRGRRRRTWLRRRTYAAELPLDESNRWRPIAPAASATAPETGRCHGRGRWCGREDSNLHGLPR